MSKQRLNVLIGTATLILGTLIYILFRSNSYIAKCFDDFEFVVCARRVLSPYSCDFLKFYLPDFLWGFSLCCGLQAIHNPGVRGTIACGCIALFCGCIWEMLQYLRVVRGTGDVIDMIMYLFASFTSILINLKERKNEKD